MRRLFPASPRRRPASLRLERLEERDNPTVFNPSQILQAYGFNQVAKVNGTALDGTGQTIAIVDAYYDPFAQSDLATFDSTYSLPVAKFSQVGQSGGSPTSYSQNSGWGGETSLDIEWAHAIAPGANILLVEASNPNNLDTAVNYARTVPGVVVVSMSWGGGESSGETSSNVNNTFTTPSGHLDSETLPGGVALQGGVAFVASAGDTGAEAISPSVSPNVLSVGGTSLTLSGSNISESAWNDGGGGPSLYFNKPSYQTAYSGSMRGTPDVAYDANPNTGFDIYNSYAGGLEQVGGTSAGAPQWAALITLADQGRALLGLGSLDGLSQLLPAIYSMPETNFNDVTSGSNGYNATTGYDLATGLGSPKAQLVISSLIAYGATSAPAITTQPVSQSVTAGQTATFTAAASGNPAPTVQWQVSSDGGATFTNISGANSVSYTTPVTVAANNGYEYQAVFTNGVGSAATTNPATLTVGVAPRVTTQPSGQLVTAGQTATFTADASGTPAPSVQWQIRIGSGPFTSISGATGTTYSFTPTLADSGDQFRAVFMNSIGSANTFAVPLTVVAPVTVASVQVGDATAERSEVRSVTVTFSGPVNFAGGNAAAAFQLQHLTDGNNVVLAAAISTNASGQTVVALTFSGAETDPFSGENGGQLSLADGTYTLTINAASVTDANGAALDGIGDGVAGSGNYVSPADTQGGRTGQLGLFRLFGDTNGDGVVDQVDLAAFRSAFNASAGDPLYVSYLDADNSGVVDQLDLSQFRSRFNASVYAS